MAGAGAQPRRTADAGATDPRRAGLTEARGRGAVVRMGESFATSVAASRRVYRNAPRHARMRPAAGALGPAAKPEVADALPRARGNGAGRDRRGTGFHFQHGAEDRSGKGSDPTAVRVPCHAGPAYSICRRRANSSSRRDLAPECQHTKSSPLGGGGWVVASFMTLAISVPANSAYRHPKAGPAKNVCMSLTPGCPCAAVRRS